MKRLLILAALFTCPAFAQHTYWRLITTSTSSSFAMVGQWISYDSGGSTISTAGGSATASSQTFGAASNAFNGTTNCSTFWQAGNNGMTGEWLEYQFASPVSIDHFDLVYGCNGGTYGLVDFELQYSDNNSTWTKLYAVNGASSSGSTHTFSFSSSNVMPASPSIYWRLSFNLTASCYGMSSMQFFTLANAGGSSIDMTPYAVVATAFGPNTGAHAAINANGGQAWSSVNGTTRTETWTYAFASSVSPGSIQYSNANIGGCTPTLPGNLAVLYSYDNVTYTSANTFTPTWVGTQTKTFNITGGPGSSQVGAFLVGP